MTNLPPTFPARVFLSASAGLLAVLFLAGCGSSDDEQMVTQGLTGTVTLTISDPPTCKGPLAPSDLKFNRIWVTVTRVRAHLSESTDSNSDGWVDLADLRDNPRQINLLDSNGVCILTTLGVTSGLPAGNYQQIRVHLLSNKPGSGEATPSPNACEAVGGFNCAELADGTPKLLRLTSQAQSGLKIPPGRIAGGALRLEAAQAADVNIEFNGCRSVVAQGNGELRLLPTLNAGEVSAADTISGRIVNRMTGDPLLDATIVVLVEQVDSEGIDRVILETMGDPAQATFSLCPVPMGNFDVVAAAIDANGVTFNATITFDVPAGTDMGDVPLEPETGTDTSPAVLEGEVTTTDPANAATSADIKLAALQEVDQNGTPVRVTIPLFGDSTPNLMTESDAACPAGTQCASYTLNVPASNPVLGTFDPAGTNYTGPAMDGVLYRVNARAFQPGSTDPNCTPASLTTDAVTVSAAMPTTVPTIAFTGCTAGN